jgi:hypothetical protein
VAGHLQEEMEALRAGGQILSELGLWKGLKMILGMSGFFGKTVKEYTNGAENLTGEEI